MPEEITGKLLKLIYRSLESDFIIGSFSEQTDRHFVAVGDILKSTTGITYTLYGKWFENAKYGKQFQFSSYCIHEPVNSEEIAIFLEKNIKGLGPVSANRLVEKYGTDTIRILKEAPERISIENKGITQKLACSIAEQLQENDAMQKILIKLNGLFVKVKNIPKNLAGNLIKTYGLTAYEVVMNNPYILADMPRIGFVLADRMALSLCNIQQDSELRLRAGILYMISETLQSTGHVWLTVEAVIEEVKKLISSADDTAIKKIITSLGNENILRLTVPNLVTLTQLSQDEDIITNRLTQFFG